MAAYIISDVTFRDQEALESYRSLAAASIISRGGHYVARGGAIDVLEGDWRPRTVIVVEFPDMDTARAWYASPEYGEALAFRDEALSRNLILVDGV
jgi:uncharacterized protein (DUF1330 family)